MYLSLPGLCFPLRPRPLTTASASDWPDHGEIDIMEALNRAGTNMVSVHTTNGCSMAVQRLMQGVANSSNCDADVNYNQGCDVTNTPGSFGSAFNTAGGAVMALEWRAQGIRVWQFPRGQLPRDLAAAGNATLTNPDPSTWGPPLADFPSTQCDISSYFKNASITANIDLCGPAMDGGKYESSQCMCWCLFPPQVELSWLTSSPTRPRQLRRHVVQVSWQRRVAKQLHRLRGQKPDRLRGGLLGVWRLRGLPGLLMHATAAFERLMIVLPCTRPTGLWDTCVRND